MKPPAAPPKKNANSATSIFFGLCCVEKHMIFNQGWVRDQSPKIAVFFWCSGWSILNICIAEILLRTVTKCFLVINALP